MATSIQQLTSSLGQGTAPQKTNSQPAVQSGSRMQAGARTTAPTTAQTGGSSGLNSIQQLTQSIREGSGSKTNSIQQLTEQVSNPYLRTLKRIIDYANDDTFDLKKTKNYILEAEKNIRQIREESAGLHNDEDYLWYKNLETSYTNVLDYLTKRGNYENTFEFQRNRDSLQTEKATLGELQRRRDELHGSTTSTWDWQSRQQDMQELDNQIKKQEGVVNALQAKVDAYQPNTNERREELIQKLQTKNAYDAEIEKNLGYSADQMYENETTKAQWDAEYTRLRNRDRQELKELDESLFNESQDYTALDRFNSWESGTWRGIGSSLASAGDTMLRGLSESGEQRIRNRDGGLLGDRSGIESLEKPGEAYVRNYETRREEQGPDLMERASKQLQEAADRLGESAMEDLRMAKTGASRGAQIAMDIGTNVVQMGFDAAVGAATHTGMASMFIRVFGDQARQVRLAGGDLNAQLAEGITRASIELFTEKMFDGLAGIYGAGAADDMIEELVENLTRTRLGQNLMRAVAGSVGEGAEEVMSDLLGTFSDMIWKNQSFREAFDNNMADALTDFLLGAAVGGLGGAAGVVGDTANMVSGDRLQLDIGGYRTRNAEIQFNRDLREAGADPKLFREVAERSALGDQTPLNEKEMSAWQAGQKMLQERQVKVYEQMTKEALERVGAKSSLQGSVDLSNVQVGFGGKAVYLSGFTRENGKTTVELKTAADADAVFTVDPGKIEWYPKNLDSIPDNQMTAAQRQQRLTGRFLQELTKQEHGEVMAMLYNPGQDTGTFINQWTIAERVYGRLARNASLDTVLQAPELSALTAEQKQAAYEIGRAELNEAEKRTAVPEGVDIKSLKPGAGKVSYDGATVDGVTYDAVSMATLTEEQQTQINVLETMARVTGVNVVFYQSQVNAAGKYQGANGLYKNGTIYIDVNAGLDSITEDGRTVGEVAMVRTAAHELTHFIQDFNPAQYEKLRSFIIDTLLEEKGMDSLDELIAEKMNRDQSGKITREEAIDEIIADGCEMMLRDSKAIERLAVEQPGIAQRIRRWIGQWVKKIQAAFKGVDARHREARLMMQHAEQLQVLWDEAFENAARSAGSRQSDSRAGYEETAQEGGGQYSLRDTPIPTREELEAKDPIPVTDIRTSATGNAREQREDFWNSKEASEIFRTPVKNNDTNEMLFLSPSTATHVFKNKGLENITMVRKLRELAGNAILTHGEPSRRAPRDNTTGVFRFFGAVRTEQGIQPAKLTVKEYNIRGQSLPSNVKEYLRAGHEADTYAGVYDGKVLVLEEIENETSGSVASPPAEAGLDNYPSVSNISVADLLNLVKGEDQKYIPQREDRTHYSDREYRGDPRWRKYNGIEDEAARHFGTTEDYRTTGYLMPDGRKLDFSGAHWLEGYDDAYIADWRRKNDIRQVDHEDIYEAFEQMSDNPPSDSARVFIERGNIRVAPEAPGIELSSKAEPTSAQYSEIRELIRTVSQGSFYVDIMTDGRSRHERLKYSGTVNPERVVNDIRHYFQTGEIRQQSEVARFRYSARDVVDDYGIKRLNDYIGVQKDVIRTLENEQFFDGVKNIVKMISGDLTVEINRRGIRETLGKGDRFQTLSRELKLKKLATIRQLPELIRTATIEEDNVSNRHNESSDIQYAYLRNTAEIDGVLHEVTISIRKSRQKNLFWIHEIRTDKAQSRVIPAGIQESEVGYTDALRSGAETTLPQTGEESNRKFSEREYMNATEAGDTERFNQRSNDIRYSVREEWIGELDKWLKDTEKNPSLRATSHGYFRIGTTADVLKDIGVKNHPVFWRKYKIGEILEDHPEIDPEILKQVPEMMEHPVFVMKSLTHPDSLTMIGDLRGNDGNTVMAALQLTPKSGGNTEAEFALLTTAHGREKKRIEHLLKESEILYLDLDVLRAGTWSMQLRVQFPSGQPSSGSVGSVTYEGKTVKISGVKLSGIGGEVIDQEAEARHSEREYGPDERELVREYAARPDVHDEFLEKWLKKTQTAEALQLRIQDYNRSIRNLEERIRKADAGEQSIMPVTEEDRTLLQKLRDSREKLSVRLNRLQQSIRGMERTQNYRRIADRTRQEWNGDPRETAKIIRELREMNRQLEEQVSYWRKEGRITPPEERKAKHADVQRYARELAQQLGYRGSMADLTAMLQEMADMIVSGDNGNGLSWSELQERAHYIARELTNNAVIEFDPEQDTRESLRSRLSELRIRPDAEWTGDFGDWNDFRQRNFNRLFFSREGQSIDDVYQQLNGEFGDGLFPPEVTAGSDQVYQILAALDRLRPIERSAFQDTDEMAMATAYYQNQIMETLLYGDIGEELSQADRDYRSLGERLRRAQEEARNSKKTLQELQRMQRHEVRAALENQRERMREREIREKTRRNIQRTGLRLLKYLTENNGQKNPIPEPMKEAVGNLLLSLDISGGLESGRRKRYQQDMAAVMRIVAEQNRYLAGETDKWSGMMLDIPADMLEQLNDHLANIQEAAYQATESGRVWNPYMMDIEELKRLDEIMTVFTRAITNANEILSSARGIKISDMASQGLRFLNSLGTDNQNRSRSRETLNRFLRWQNTTPYYYFKKLGQPGLEMFGMIQDGWDKFAFNAKQVVDFTEEAYTAEEARKIQEEVLTFDLRRRGDLSEGFDKPEKVTMTKAQVMSLYCLWKREQARGHIAGAGIRVADYERGREKITQAENYLLDLTDVAKIIDTLSAREKEIADTLQNYMNTVGSEWGNEVSMKRFGIRSFTEENYFPITTDDRTRQLRNPASDTANLYRLLNMSFTKATVREASNPLVLDNIFDVFANHMADMAKYNGLGLPMLDAMKWFSYTVMDEADPESGQYGYESIQKSAERAYGKEARNYFITFMQDLNGVREGGRGEDFASKMLSNYKVAAVGANLRVAVLQPTSYVRAAAVIDPKYLAQGLQMNNRQGQKEAETYSGTAIWKALGFYDTNINAGLREMIKHADGAREQLQELSMKGAEAGDKITWGALWNACKAEQKALNRGITEEELMERTARRFREVVYRTQVMDSTMTRSHVMRQKGAYAGMVTAFMSEPTLSFNMLLDAYGEYETRLRQGENRSEAWQKSKGTITKAFGAYIATATLSAVVESCIDAARDDDEYANYLERWLNKMLGFNVKGKNLSFGEAFKGFLSGNFMEDLLVHNKLPIIKDFFATLAGNSSSTRMDTEWMGNIVKAGQIWGESIALAAGWKENATSATYNGNMTVWGKIYSTLRAASQLTGLPVGNAMRDAVAIWNTSVGEFAPGMKIQTYDPGEEKSIMYAVKDGYLTEDEAVRWMMRYGLADTETEARQQVFIWENSGKFTRLKEAVAAGNDTEVTAATEELIELTFRPSEIQQAIKEQIRESYVGGDGKVRISKEEAVRRLMEYGGAARTIDAERAVQQWTSEIVTGIRWEDIGETYISGDITRERALEMLKLYGDYNDEQAEKKVLLWSSEAETGIAYDDIGEAYRYGEITRQQAEQMFAHYGSMSEDEAVLKVKAVDFERDFGYTMDRVNIQADYADGGYTHDQMKQILLDYGYSKSEQSAESTVTRWDFVGQDWSLDSISGYDAQRYYNFDIDKSGISKEEWIDWLEQAKAEEKAGNLSATPSGKYKKNGDPVYISYSKVDKILAFIDSFPISNEEKEALFLAGWDSNSEGNAKNLKRAPWRKRG